MKKKIISHNLDPELAAFLVEEMRPLLEERLPLMLAEIVSAALPSLPTLLSAKQVAKILSISDRTLDDLIALGDLKPLWIKGQRRFDPRTIEAYLRKKAA